MKTIPRPKQEEIPEISEDVQYDIAAINFAHVVSQRYVMESDYTASLVAFLNRYPTHFQRRRVDELDTAGRIIRQDIDEITGVSCPTTVEEVSVLFANYIQDETGTRLAQTPGCSPIGRAAILTMLHCIDQYPTPKIIES